jgi:hypothetical protein
MQVDGKGTRGGDVMTKTHAMGSGISYAMRYLFRMVFNLAINQDDDGNAAGWRIRACVLAPMNGAAAPNDTHDVAARGEVEARRAAVQLRNSLPQYVCEPPSRRLKADRLLDKERHTGNAWETKIKAEQRREGRFRQPLPAGGQVYNERNPPPDDSIPGFLDRRGGRR